jgi:hypothetical protein
VGREVSLLRSESPARHQNPDRRQTPVRQRRRTGALVAGLAFAMVVTVVMLGLALATTSAPWADSRNVSIGGRS